MKKRILYLTVIVFLCLSNTIAFAGGWTQKRGEGYYKIGFRVTQADMFYDGSGNKMRVPTFTDVTTSFYGEYGLTNRVTLIASVPFYKRLTMEREIGISGDKLNNSGFADSDVGFRVGLLGIGNSVVSAEVLFGLPIGDDSQPDGLLTGDGEFNQLFKLGFGHSFYPKPAYFSAEVGFNNRTQGYSDEIHYAAEIGYSFGNKWLVDFKIRGIRSIKNGSDTVVGGMATSTANNQSYLSYGAEINYLINASIGLTLGVDSATFIENTIGAPTYSFGIFYK